MARYIRLYESPSQEKQGNILGFSSGIARTADDSELHSWLGEHGYTVTPESEAQKNAKYAISLMIFGTAEYRKAEGIPLPSNTVSSGHLFIEPPIKENHLSQLGEFLSHLASLDDGGLRQYFVIDNRNEDPQAYDFDPNNVIAWWG